MSPLDHEHGAPGTKPRAPFLDLTAEDEEQEEYAKRTPNYLAEDNMAATGSNPSSPEFLLPAFESSLHISSWPNTEQRRQGQGSNTATAVTANSFSSNAPGKTNACSPTSKDLSGSPPFRRFRSLSKSNTIKRLKNTSPPPAQPLLDSNDIRRFRKAEQRLSESVYYLSKKYHARPVLPLHMPSAAPEVVSPAPPLDATRAEDEHIPSPASPPSTPSHAASPSRRARLVRALTLSPPISPIRGSPASPPPQITPRSRSGRRWSQALHAILSPSPSLTREQLPTLASASDVAWAESTSSSPIVNSSEVRRWEIVAAVESTRRAQSDMLKLVRDLIAKADKKPLMDIPEMKESVLFLAQFLQCGGQVPDMQILNELFSTVRRLGIRLCKSLSHLRNREVPQANFDDKYKPSAILCHCLKNPREQEIDVFGVKVAMIRNEHELLTRMRSLVQHYQEFVTSLREYHVQYRLERRAKRRERRLARMDKASTLFECGSAGDVPVSPAAAEIATMSTQELLQHSLRQAIADKLFDNEDVEAFEPRLMLTLPRLALFYGVRHSAFPASPTSRVDDNPYFVIPMEVFLPRICRKLPQEVITAVRCLDDHRALELARKLSGVEEEYSVATACSDPQIDELFRNISKEGDAGSGSSRDPRANKLLSRALALHMSDGAEDYTLDDDSTISKAYIMLMGIASI